MHHQGRCYGCSSASTEHCITLLKALTFQSNTRKPLVREKLIRELVEVNLRSGSAHMQRDIRRLLCQLTRSDLNYQLVLLLNVCRLDKIADIKVHAGSLCTRKLWAEFLS